MPLPEPKHEIWSGFWRAIGAALATGALYLLGQCTESLKTMVAGWYGNHATSGKINLTILLFSGAIVLFSSIAYRCLRHNRKAAVPVVPPGSYQVIPLPIIKPGPMAFHVLKWFGTLGRDHDANIPVVAHLCGLTTEDAKTSVQELKQWDYIYLTQSAPGEWNGRYAITARGKACIAQYAT